MTKRDFFIVLLKIFGLYWLSNILFTFLPSSISVIQYGLDITSTLWLIFNVVLYLGLTYLFLVKADKLSNFLKLEKGFDEERIDFGQLKLMALIKFAVILIGGYLFLFNLPYFLGDTFFAFYSKVPKGLEGYFEDDELMRRYGVEEYINWFGLGFQVLIGYLMVVNFKKISQFIHGRISEKSSD